MLFAQCNNSFRDPVPMNVQFHCSRLYLIFCSAFFRRVGSDGQVYCASHAAHHTEDEFKVSLTPALV